jgi:hypothetical protein
MATMWLRRSLLGAICAILDPTDEAGRKLYGPDEPSALKVFLNTTHDAAIDRFLAEPGRWSPSLARRIEEKRQKDRQDRTIGKLQRAIGRLRQAFATPCGPTEQESGERRERI